ncbi:diguanylate cyclase [Vibrio sinaloensis]|nr:diguanylate cyclase [Vibrio sinaloensis]
MYLDVNRFKQINDSYGHEVGDQVLRTVANHVIRFLARKQLSNRGGDEFVLVGKVGESEVNYLKERFCVDPVSF